MTRDFSYKNQAMSIVGMDAFWGSFIGLDAFERSIYAGKQHSISFPTQETLAEKSTHEETLIKVAENALKDAGIKPGENITIITVTATETFLQQLKEKWNFTGIVLALTDEENSAYQALQLAKQILQAKEAEAVIVAIACEAKDVLSRMQATQINTGVNTLSYDQKVNGFMLGEGAGAVVLKLHETAKQSGNSIYAVIDAIGLVIKDLSSQEQLDAEAVTQTLSQVMLAILKWLLVGFHSKMMQKSKA
jgi:3-oxoacyl-[acyl-carrier-protein] synthase III